MNQNKYPALEMNIRAIRENTEVLASLLESRGISLTGVVKGFNALPEGVDQMVAGGCRHIASSRLEQLAAMKNRGVDLPLMLLRLPMLSEIDELVQVADISLNSEWETVSALDRASAAHGRQHGVVLMQDMGDLREGFYDPEELIALALHIENTLKNLTLKGIGTNLGCYGAIKPSTHNLGALVQTAARIEAAIGRPLEIVSGGATSSLPLLVSGTMPKGINNLRIGEGLLVNRDLPEYWGVSIPGLRNDTFLLKAEVIEIKEKPSHPVGEIFIDAFGGSPTFADRGNRRRAILAVGKQDVCDLTQLVPMTSGIEIVGGSSDHLILDIEDCPAALAVGDILSFGIHYGPMLFLSGAAGIHKICRNT